MLKAVSRELCIMLLGQRAFYIYTLTALNIRDNRINILYSMSKISLLNTSLNKKDRKL